MREINRAAVRLAREAAGERAYVAGAIGPTSLVGAREQAEALAEGGVDAILIETMRSAEEMELAVEGVRLAVGQSLPLIALASIDASLTMADGTPIERMGERLKALGCDAVGVNCSDSPETTLAAAARLVPLGLPVAAMPSAGLPRRVGDRFVYEPTPEDFGQLALRLRDVGARLIGGCCGASPAHIRRMAEALQGSPQ